MTILCLLKREPDATEKEIIAALGTERLSVVDLRTSGTTPGSSTGSSPRTRSSPGRDNVARGRGRLRRRTMNLGILVNTDRNLAALRGIVAAATGKGHEVAIFAMDDGTRLLSTAASRTWRRFPASRSPSATTAPSTWAPSRRARRPGSRSAASSTTPT